MMTLIDSVWTRLSQTTSLSFKSTSAAECSTGWNAEATGTVSVANDEKDRMIFSESGFWVNQKGQRFRFSNAYRWQRKPNSIQLEHLRFGTSNPVYLFDLVSVSDSQMASVEPHVCSEDIYTANLEIKDGSILLSWRVVGPSMDESISYRYFWSENHGGSVDVDLSRANSDF